MKEIIVRGKEYEKLATSEEVIKKAIFYNSDNQLLVYEGNGKLRIPGIFSKNEDEFYSFLANNVDLPYCKENMELYLKLKEYYFRYRKINNKLKKNYIMKIRDYYCTHVEFDSAMLSKIRSIEYPDKILQPKIIPIEQATESMFLYNQASYTARALCEFQKIKKR